MDKSLVSENIDLPVCRCDLPTQHLCCLANFGFSESFVQPQHQIDKADYLAVTGNVGWIVEINGADGKLGNIHWFVFEISAP
jgi:hypothetical protein